MSDILKQIQALQEQFSNLFEVEGLGDPSSDVPPSENKLKRRVKTKNGKAELVSVENELFPYEGTKKEQFQQKVLDVINGMIQGTSTLQDLLQVVREKKAPLKEAMEVLEELIGEDGRHEELMKKYGTDTVQKLPKEVRRKYFPTNRDEVIDGGERYKAGSKSRSHQDLNQYGPEQGKKFKVNLRGKYKEPEVSGNKEAFGYIGKYEPKSDEQRTQGSVARHFDKVLYKPLKKQANITRKAIATEKFKRENSEALKEAMELMEDLFSTILKQPDEKQGALVYKYHQAKNKEHAGKDTYTQAKEEEKRKSKEEKGQEKTEQRKKYRGKSVEDWKLGRLMDQIARNAKNLGKVEDSATAKAVRRNAQKADLKEALEIMEDLWSKVQEQPSDKKKELTRMYHKMKQKEGKTTSDIIDDRKKHMTKQEKGQEKTEERNQEARKNYLDAARDYAESTPSMYQFEALKEALEIMEAIINEVSIGALARATENNLPKRKKNEEIAIKAYKQAQNEYEKGSKESPEDEPALYKKLQCTDKAACKEFDKARDAENLKDLNLPKDSKVSANKLFNAAKKVNPERQKKTEETVKNTKGTREDAKKFLNSLKRDNRSFDISLADPVKSRNEADQ